MERLRYKPEILAPAGSIESLKGAVCAGADAVYIGGSKFGARAYADNPEADMLLHAIDYVHSKDRRIYLTVNTLLKEQELTKELYSFLEKYYRAGVDAVIVQDVGVLHFLASEFPELPVHASTQMTLVSPDGAAMLSGYPVTRIVPARELSLAEIQNLRDNTKLEIEAFVHGALCYCYSGQCLFSSMIGGRSGNRGRCAQPCRMSYGVSEDGKKKAELYALSPKDLCTLDQIPKLVEAGIDSFKIEGRMKRPEYTAGVTAAYRMMTDLYYEQGEEEFYRYLEKHPEVLTEQMDRMTDLYNRGGFTKGYYVHYHGKQMMSMERPNHSGTKVGEVTKVQGIRATIRLEKTLNPQDVLEIRTRGGESYEFTAGKAGIEQKAGWYETNVKKGFPLEPGQQVYRTKNEELLGELRESYVEKLFQIPVEAEFVAIPGQPASLTIRVEAHGQSSLVPGGDAEAVRRVEVTVEGDMVMEAKNQPVTEDKIREQLSKTGESEYYFRKLSITTGEKTFLPIGKIKELRRTAFEQLREKVLEGYRRTICKQGTETEKKVQEMDSAVQEGPVEIIALVSTKEQWETVCAEDRITTVYVDLQNEPLENQISCCERVKEQGRKAFLVMPHIFRRKEKERYSIIVERIRRSSLDGVLVKSLEELTFLEEHGLTKVLEVRLNYNLYTMQTEAKSFFKEKGYHHFTVPVELNEEEIQGLGVEDCDFILYGRFPLMISAQCVRDNVFHCLGGTKTEGIILTDRVGAEFPVRQICTSCYNVIYNSACTSLIGMEMERKFRPAGWRFDFTVESGTEMKAVLEAYFNGTTEKTGKGPYTKGHFKRGVE